MMVRLDEDTEKSSLDFTVNLRKHLKWNQSAGYQRTLNRIGHSALRLLWSWVYATRLSISKKFHLANSYLLVFSHVCAVVDCIIISFIFFFYFFLFFFFFCSLVIFFWFVSYLFYSSFLFLYWFNFFDLDALFLCAIFFSIIFFIFGSCCCA